MVGWPFLDVLRSRKRSGMGQGTVSDMKRLKQPPASWPHARVAPDCRAALRDLEDGMTIGVGGALNSGHPMALVRALLQSDLKDLTLVSGFGGMEMDMLAGSGMVRRLIAAFVGNEGVSGLPPLTRWACETDRIDAWDVDEGLLLVAWRAAAQNLPYAIWRGGMGTHATKNPLTEEAVDEATGIHYLKVKPIRLDVSLYWAEAADTEGNVLRWGPDFGDIALVEASALRIVQVERIVPTRRLAQAPDRVMPWQADIVVASPLGTYPFASTTLNDDPHWLNTYMKIMSNLHKEGDWEKVRPALRSLLCLDGDGDAFLEAVGVRRLRELMA